MNYKVKQVSTGLYLAGFGEEAFTLLMTPRSDLAIVLDLPIESNWLVDGIEYVAEEVNDAVTN